MLRQPGNLCLAGRLLGRTGLAAVAAVAALSLGLAGTAAGHAPAAHSAGYRQQCPEPYPAQRDQFNPLDLPTAPGADPLNGARFYVPGPAKGSAAAAIAQLMGLNPKTMSVSESWARFQSDVSGGSLGGRVAHNPGLAHQVAELSKIASQPEAQRLSIYSEGGGAGAIFGQAEKIFCSNMQADPGSVPIFNTYFLHAKLGGCPTPAAVRAYTPTFQRQVNEMAAATDRRPAVFLLEIDALGSSGCVARMGSLGLWEADLRYEMTAMASLPHTVVYVEGGYSDSNSVAYTAKVLNAIHVNRIQGFFTNDTHQNWTINEIRWATKVAKRTHGAHFIVNTADNGRGPLLNRNRVKNGNADLCNPPGRGLGPLLNTATGYPYVDALMWTHPPGNSSGCGGGPPGGVFWPARAIMLAQNADQKLGPGFPSQPY
ncbi:MAG TPA: glycoside hydrolase family 6 protein [Solirubrobacteraceae bacterium]|nr:glycoside hydrolase family 6 protein [Solirubrobacteraceae bacterium]